MKARFFKSFERSFRVISIFPSRFIPAVFKRLRTRGVRKYLFRGYEYLFGVVTLLRPDIYRFSGESFERPDAPALFAYKI